MTIKKKTAAVIKKRKSNYNAFVLKKFENEKNPGKFFHHLKCLEGKNLGPRWSPTDMFPGEDAQEVAERLATFFNSISDEYTPLGPDGVPRSFNQRVLPYLSVDQVGTAMKEAKKPTSMVPGDIPAVLYNRFTNKLSPPVTHVFNLITEQQEWPEAWKREYVTVIPKNCLLYTSPSPRDRQKSRMPSSA